MRRQDKELTDPGMLETIIRAANVCRIALCDGETPYVVPVCFGYKDRQVFFHCAPEGRKREILRRNPKVCVEFETDVALVTESRPCGCSMRYRSVLGWGKAVVLTDDAAKREGLDCIMRQYGQTEAAYPKEAIDRTLVIRIDLDELTGKQSRIP